MARNQGASWQQQDPSAWGNSRRATEDYYKQLRESGGLYGGDVKDRNRLFRLDTYMDALQSGTQHSTNKSTNSLNQSLPTKLSKVNKANPRGPVVRGTNPGRQPAEGMGVRNPVFKAQGQQNPNARYQCGPSSTSQGTPQRRAPRPPNQQRRSPQTPQGPTNGNFWLIVVGILIVLFIAGRF